MSLDKDEMRMCDLMGCSPEAYEAARNGKAIPQGLTVDDMAMCEALGADPVHYIAAKKVETDTLAQFKAPAEGEIVALFFPLPGPEQEVGQI